MNGWCIANFTSQNIFFLTKLMNFTSNVFPKVTFLHQLQYSILYRIGIFVAKIKLVHWYFRFRYTFALFFSQSCFRGASSKLLILCYLLVHFTYIVLLLLFLSWCFFLILRWLIGFHSIFWTCVLILGPSIIINV